MEVFAAVLVGGVGTYYHSRLVICVAAFYAVYMVGFAIASNWSDTLFGKTSIRQQHVQFMRMLVILLLLVSVVVDLIRRK